MKMQMSTNRYDTQVLSAVHAVLGISLTLSFPIWALVVRKMVVGVTHTV